MNDCGLPIEEVLPQIVSALRGAGRAVIAAPPGAGKSTVIPPKLLELCDDSGRILLLQPRRVAARAVAARIATLMNTPLGQDVGYQVRLDRHWTDASRIVVMTYGVALRRLQTDPFLESFGTVLLDEFHERSLEADLTLGILRRVRADLRGDLRVAAMSATLDAQPIAAYLDDAPLIVSQGRTFPVEVRYAKRMDQGSLVDRVVELLPAVLRADRGDVLVFLPGVGEIRRIAGRLQRAGWLDGTDVYELYGDLPADKQDRVLAPSDRRKLILATNVAETSLTIDGVTQVVDTGVARVARVDPGLGMPRLDLEPISRASADQRAGRAGRTARGICHRMWMEPTHRARPEFDTPEVLRGDLATSVLRLHGWGETDIHAFPWLTPPHSEAVDAAEQLLERLEAIAGKCLTPLGRRLLSIPAHPRIARLLIAAVESDVARPACALAAILSERDPMVDMVGERLSRDQLALLGLDQADIVDRAVRFLHWIDGADDSAIHRSVGQATKAAFKQFEQALHAVHKETDIQTAPENHDPGLAAGEDVLHAKLSQALLRAFPDRVAKRRHPGGDRGLMVGSAGVRVRDDSLPLDAEYFLCIEALRKSGDADVRRAVPIDEQWLVGGNLNERVEYFLHPTMQSVVGRQRRYWLDLLVQETPAEIVDRQMASQILASHVVATWPAAFPANDPAVSQFLARLKFLSQQPGLENIPAVDEKLLREVAESVCAGRVSIAEVKQAPWLDYLAGVVGYEIVQAMDQLAPVALEIPSGKRIEIDYADPAGPSLKARLQELFGWLETPRIAGGRHSLLLRILAPNYREVQVTRDLANFWRSTYAEVRKELRRRYPKHQWPDDPYTATANRSGLKKRQE